MRIVLILHAPVPWVPARRTKMRQPSLWVYLALTAMLYSLDPTRLGHVLFPNTIWGTRWHAVASERTIPAETKCRWRLVVAFLILQLSKQ